jgi:hypothetical protein
MSRYLIGRSPGNRQNVYLPIKTLPTHTHLIGATGTGKSTLIMRILAQLMIGMVNPTTIFVIDPLGGLANVILNFMAHPTLCPESVRKRLVYIEPAKTEYCMPFNPLIFDDENDLYYRTGRTSDVMLRSGKSHDMTLMLRLRRWLYNCFYSVGALGYAPATAQFLIQPGTDQHDQLLRQIPDRLRNEWAEILKAGLRERIHALDSTRNRLNPYFTCPVLNNMFSSTQSYFDVPRFMREKKIVVVNLAPKGKIDPHVANAIGGMMVNEIVQTARNLPKEIVDPTMLVLDEFQNFVSEEMYSTLPETRQLGLQLLLSHQSFSQLLQGEIDMRGIVWQARNRFMFANDADDADLLAHELASLSYDPKSLKDQIEVFRQKKIGQKLIRLNNFSSTSTKSNAYDETSSHGSSRGRSYNSNDPFGGITHTEGSNVNRGSSRKQADSSGSNHGWSETLIDELEDFYEVSSRTYHTFDEQMRIWAKRVRRLLTGEALGKFKDDNRIHHIDVDQVVIPMIPALVDLKAKSLEENFANRELFIPTVAIQERWADFTARLGAGTSIPPNQREIVDAIRIEHGGDSNNDSIFR